MVRQNSRFFIWATVAALALRFLFFFTISRITVDSLFYADLGKNLLLHHTYAVTDNDQILPTFARLPGYPAFMAMMFAVFGVNAFKPVLVLQIFLDVVTCFVIADLARSANTRR